MIPYGDEHASAFRSINEEWLAGYGLLESHDVEVLTNPRATILDQGGVIFLAELDHQIVGTAALMKEDDGVYELVKMGVIAGYRGRGISRLLLNACLEKARELGARKIILFSNSRLTTAIALYEKYGFMHIPVTGSPFETADVKMELRLI